MTNLSVIQLANHLHHFCYTFQTLVYVSYIVSLIFTKVCITIDIVLMQPVMVELLSQVDHLNLLKTCQSHGNEVPTCIAAVDVQY